MTKTIHSDFSGHALFVREIKPDKFPFNADGSYSNYSQFWEVRNFDANGVIFMYLGRDKNVSREIVAWYPNGKFWGGYGTTFKEAIEGAQKDGWLYTN